jgi:hypothetical protein
MLIVFVVRCRKSVKPTSLKKHMTIPTKQPQRTIYFVTKVCAGMFRKVQTGELTFETPEQRERARNQPKVFPNGSQICTQCGNIGRPKTVTPGSLLIEIILWCAFLIPGICYSLWRLSARHQACPSCLTKTMIELDCPVGRKLLSDYHSTPGGPK